MMKRGVAMLATLLFALCIPFDESASAKKFGDTPFSLLRQAADDHKNDHAGCQVSQDQLSARMLSITWPESTGNDDGKNPAPMTMDRWAWDSDLFFNQNSGENDARRRAYWIPGISMYQLDDAYHGTDMAGGKFSSGASAQKTASVMIDLLCSNSGVYSPWLACDIGQHCAEHYADIYDPSGPLQSIDHTASIGEWGGTRSRTCYYGTVGGTPETFPCKFVDHANADGYTGSWTDQPNGDNQTGHGPLPWPFYVYNQQNQAGNTVEVRVWMAADTGLNTTLRVNRVYGTNPRTNLNYFTDTWLCDDSRSCPQP